MTDNDQTPQQPIQQQLQIELGEKEAEGIYSNLAIITHSPAEFIIDFTRVTPGVPRARVHARIIMTPQHFKLLLNAMRENIERYEQQYGEMYRSPERAPLRLSHQRSYACFRLGEQR